MDENISELLTLDTPIIAPDAASQLGALMGLDDDGIFAQFPQLRDFEGDITFRNEMSKVFEMNGYSAHFSMVAKDQGKEVFALTVSKHNRSNGWNIVDHDSIDRFGEAA